MRSEPAVADGDARLAVSRRREFSGTDSLEDPVDGVDDFRRALADTSDVVGTGLDIFDAQAAERCFKITELAGEPVQ
jgi:hypothetical protein